jgi:DNA-binding NtrC family response regulator
VLSAETASSALKLIGANPRIDLVFSDVVMPDGMSGVELARQIGSLRPELPILLTSGYTAHHVLPEIPTGELALLKKPFSQADLSIAIRNLMAASLEGQRYQPAK